METLSYSNAIKSCTDSASLPMLEHFPFPCLLHFEIQCIFDGDGCSRSTTKVNWHWALRWVRGRGVVWTALQNVQLRLTTLKGMPLHRITSVIW